MNNQVHPGPPVPVPYSDSKPKRVLSRNMAACTYPRAHGLVNVVYPDAIEMCGNLGTVKGLGVLGGIITLSNSVMTIYASYDTLVQNLDHPVPKIRGIYPEDVILSIAFFIISLLFLAAATWFLRRDLFTYREPILFNRRTRKVHLFRQRINMKRPFSPWPIVVDTYDWDCIRGEVNGGVALIGSVAMMRYWLYLAVSDRPTNGNVIDRFVVGTHGTSVAEPTWHWEHIRRYMEEDGPPVQPGEWLNGNLKFSHREAWADAFPFLSRHEDVRKNVWLHLLMILGFPFMVLFGFNRWLAEATCRDPQWPQDVIDQTGGAALSDEAVRALIPPMPVQDESQLSEDEKNDRSYQAKKGKPWWTPERRKYAVLLALIGMLIGGAKLVQFGIRGY